MDLKTMVFEALKTREENGYSVVHNTPEEIAMDLVSYDADLEDYEPEDVLPFVLQYLKEGPQ